jgi:hypothetical protein
VSIATFHPPAVVYREEQSFAWWIYALLALMGVLAWVAPAWGHPVGANPAVGGHRWGIEIPLALAIGLTLPSVLVVGVLRMTTEVTPTDVRVWFGWIPTYRHMVALGTIERIEVVRYRPLADYGFWGVRIGRDGERVLNARGNRGVRLYLSDGSRLLIGSQRPEVLAVALEKAMHPDVT